MSVSINKKHVCVLTLSVILASILCIFRTYLFLTCIEPDTGLYITGTSLGKYFGAAVFLAICLCVAGCIFSKVSVPEKLTSESAAVVFSSSLCGFLFATVFFCGIYNIFLSGTKSAFFVIELLLCIPCIIFFFSLCAKETREKNIKNIILNLSPAVYYAVRTIHVFTNTKAQINTSQRSISLVMLCCMMLMFVYESYFLVKDEKDNDIKQRTSVCLKYAVFTLLSVTLSLISALPYIAVSAFWVFDAEFLAMDILDLCVGVYAFTRAATLCRQ